MKSVFSDYLKEREITGNISRGGISRNISRKNISRKIISRSLAACGLALALVLAEILPFSGISRNISRNISRTVLAAEDTSEPDYAAREAALSDMASRLTEGSRKELVYKGSSSEVIDAGSAGVPAGAEGAVLKLSGSQPGVSAVFDYTECAQSAYSLAEIRIKIYVPKGAKELNITSDGGENFIARYSLGNYEAERWNDLTFYQDGVNLVLGAKLSDLQDENGRIGRLCFSVRLDEAFEGTADIYFDCIDFKIGPDGTVPPDITYTGSSTLNYTAEKPLVLASYSAHDRAEDRDVPVELGWDGDAGIDENGNMIEGGPYTLVLSAENSYGLRGEKRISLTVRPKDTTPPEILVNTDTLYAAVGTKAAMAITATDNEDPVSVDQTWSEGALDNNGCLVAGEHTLTLKSEDFTGNVTTSTVKVVVNESGLADRDNIRREDKIDFGVFGKVFLAVLFAGIALLTVLAVLLPGRKKSAGKSGEISSEN